MRCTLMHKNIMVVDIEIEVETGYINKIGAIHNLEHLPVGTMGLGRAERNKPRRAALNEWWLGRSIPASRDKIEAALCALDVRTTKALIFKCFGLSLTDHYWVKPKDSELNWGALNFFENDFSVDVGEVLLGYGSKCASEINMISPDNTSDGWLRKRWIVKDGKRVLVKGGSGVFGQEPFNEVIATAVMERLGICHVPYYLDIEGEKVYSLCENFVTTQTEFVPAWRVLGAIKRGNSDSEFTHLLRCCEWLGMEISGVTSAIEKMLTLDYIIANEDRHYNNFGFLRNADTLEWIGFAPVFDSGTSLWYNTQRVGSTVESKPFKKSHDEQIKIVKNFEWFDSDALKNIDCNCVEILSRSDTTDTERAEAIGRNVLKRVGFVGR